MQLKVRKIQQQSQGTAPSGSWDLQREVGLSFPVVAASLYIQTLWRAVGL